MAEPDSSTNKTDPRRFPFSPCEPGSADRRPFQFPPTLIDGEELLRRRRMFLGKSPVTCKTTKSKELHKFLRIAFSTFLRCKESGAVAKSDGSKTFPYRPCEPGDLDRHHPLPIPCLPSIGELLPGRSICLGGSHGEEWLPKRRIRLCDTLDGPEGGCWICSLDEHPSNLCPYRMSHIPKNAIVGRGCVVVCKVCDALFSGRCCNQDLGCARLKFCYCCLEYGDHWSEECLDYIPDNIEDFAILGNRVR